MEDITGKRDINLDYLKCLTLIGLVIAHVTTSDFWFQLRCFDVNLLVIISAMLAAKAFDKEESKKEGFVKNYYIKRFKRLVIPAWIFITLYIGLNVMFNYQTLTETKIIRSYLLKDSKTIGYVWIIWIYMLCALLMPLLVKVDWKKKRNVLLSAGMFVLYLFLCRLTDDENFRLLCLYPIIYGLISLIGVNFDRISKKTWMICGVILMVIWGIYAYHLYAVNGMFITTGSEYKYPPTIYYLSYTIGMTLLITVIFKKADFSNCPLNNVISYISSSSLWLYLWHILALQLAKKLMLGELASIIFVIIVSICITTIQNVSVKFLKEYKINKAVLNFFREGLYGDDCSIYKE